MANLKLSILIAGKDQASKAFLKVGDTVKGLGAKIATTSDAMQKLGEASSKAGATLTKAVTLPLVGIATVSVKAAMDASRFEGALAGLAGGADRAAKYIDAVKEASLGTVASMDAAQVATRALTFGVVANADEMERLTKIAITLGKAQGLTATQAISDLTTALGRQSPMILDNLGITLKLTEAYKIYADQLGKTAEQLTDEEKKRAFTNAALVKGMEVAERLGGIQMDAASSAEQMAANLKEVSAAIGQELIPYAVAGMEKIGDLVAKFKDLDEEQRRTIITIGGIAAAAGPTLKVFGGLATALPKVASGMVVLRNATAITVRDIGTFNTMAKAAGLNIGGMVSTTAAAIVPLTAFAAAMMGIKAVVTGEWRIDSYEEYVGMMVRTGREAQIVAREIWELGIATKEQERALIGVADAAMLNSAAMNEMMAAEDEVARATEDATSRGMAARAMAAQGFNATKERITNLRDVHVEAHAAMIEAEEEAARQAEELAQRREQAWATFGTSVGGAVEQALTAYEEGNVRMSQAQEQALAEMVWHQTDAMQAMGQITEAQALSVKSAIADEYGVVVDKTSLATNTLLGLMANMAGGSKEEIDAMLGYIGNIGGATEDAVAEQKRIIGEALTNWSDYSTQQETAADAAEGFRDGFERLSAPMTDADTYARNLSTSLTELTGAPMEGFMETMPPASDLLATMGEHTTLVDDELVRMGEDAAPKAIKGIKELHPQFLPILEDVGALASSLSTANEMLSKLENRTVNVRVNYTTTGTPTGRQHGGRVRAGGAYLVGETRPELFVPNTAGTILPRVPEGGGGATWNGNIVISGAGNPDAIANAVMRRLGDRGMMPRGVTR